MSLAGAVDLVGSWLAVPAVIVYSLFKGMTTTEDE